MSNKKINLLFVSIVFPPKNDSEGLQVAKYFKYLARDKSLNIDVVTSTDNTLFMPIDENLREYDKGYRQIIKIPFFENKYINYIFRKWNKDSLNYPDSKFRFYKKWKKVLNQLEYKPDIIYSRSFPISSTIMAYKLQKKLTIPWVLHLSDPWTINPIHTLGIAKEWNENMESKCFDKAMILTFTSQLTMKLYAEKYPQHKEKMIVSLNVFDLDDKPKRTYRKEKKLKVVYTGGLVGDRSAQYFIEAVQQFKRENPEMFKDFEFIFAGALDRKNKAVFHNCESIVRHLGILTYKESLALQMEADILLVIDTPFSNSDEAMFFPSKLLDYMIMQRRIIALTNENSVTWDIVNDKLGNCIEYKDVIGTIKVLKDAWFAWCKNDIKYFEYKDLDMTFSARKNTEDLVNLFKKVLSEK